MREIYTERGIPRKRDFHGALLHVADAKSDVIPMDDKTRPLDEATKQAQSYLRLWRKSRKLTLEKLAEHTENSSSTLSAWERGERRVNMEELVKLAAFYGVKPAALLMEPQDAGPTVSRMAQAGDLALGMAEEAFEAWMATGRALKGKQ